MALVLGLLQQPIRLFSESHLAEAEDQLIFLLIEFSSLNVGLDRFDARVPFRGFLSLRQTTLQILLLRKFLIDHAFDQSLKDLGTHEVFRLGTQILCLLLRRQGWNGPFQRFR